MSYTTVKFTVCILVVTVLSATALAQPSLSLKEKLARLLMDPEFDDMDNAIFDRDDDWQQRDQLRGMLLQNRELPTRMKQRLDLKQLFKNTKSQPSEEIFEEEAEEHVETLTTTTAAPTQPANIVMMGMAPFRTMFNRFIEMIRR